MFIHEIYQIWIKSQKKHGISWIYIRLSLIIKTSQQKTQPHHLHRSQHCDGKNHQPHIPRDETIFSRDLFGFHLHHRLELLHMPSLMLQQNKHQKWLYKKSIAKLLIDKMARIKTNAFDIITSVLFSIPFFVGLEMRVDTVAVY